MPTAAFVTMAIGAMAMVMAACSGPPVANGPPVYQPLHRTAPERWPTGCIGRSASLPVYQIQNPPLCIVSGTDVTLTFDERGPGVRASRWGMPPLDVVRITGGITHSSVVLIQSSKENGPTLTARVLTVGTGSALVSAAFNQLCSPGDTSPCTIPPLAMMRVTVDVVP